MGNHLIDLVHCQRDDSKCFDSYHHHQCPAKPQPDILCLIGAPNHTRTPITPSPTITTQLIKFTYCHDRFPRQALTHKHNKYDPLINIIGISGWKTNPLITITTGVRGVIHEHSINKLANLKIPKQTIKTLMQNIHQNAIKYLTYLILNKRKWENKQTTVPPPLRKVDNIYDTTKETSSQEASRLMWHHGNP
jgi:hypothetical protein